MNLISHDGRGGADRAALDISKRLRQRGHRVIWGCPSKCYLMDEVRTAGMEVYLLDHSGNMDLTPLPAFKRFCKEEKVAIVNVHHSHGRHLLTAAKLFGLKTKAVFTRHCICGSTPYVGAFFYNRILDVNITVSNAVRQSLLRAGIRRSKAVTIYAGIEIEKFEQVRADKIASVRDRYAKRDALNIGIVARTGLNGEVSKDKRTEKRHDILFRALAEIREKINLLVLGAPRQREIDSLKLIAEDNGLDSGKITFCGFQEEIAPFYKIMDLNVLPSGNEGLGLAIIEGMAAGVPCIGANSGGLREVITNGVDGLLFKAGDSSDLADKIRTVIENESMRNSLISKGKEKVRKLFDIEKTADETEKLFYDLLG
jgi:glycosyltransferase involved in cell wall biosynthesis